MSIHYAPTSIISVVKSGVNLFVAPLNDCLFFLWLFLTFLFVVDFTSLTMIYVGMVSIVLLGVHRTS